MMDSDRQEFQRAEYISGLMTPQLVDQIKALTTVVRILLGWFSITLEVFVRRDFGERYLGWVRIYFALFILFTMRTFFFILAIFSNSLPPLLFRGPRLGLPPLFTLLIYAFIVAALLHRLRIWWRNRNGQQWHSMSFGISWLSLLPIDDWLLYRIVEPLLCFGASWLVWRLDPLTGLWLMMASLALLMKNQMAYAEQRGRYLDLVDGRIESAYFTDAMQGKPKHQTAGFSVVPVPTGPLFEHEMPDIAATVKETLGETA